LAGAFSFEVAMQAEGKKPQILVDLQGQIERVTYTND